MAGAVELVLLLFGTFLLAKTLGEIAERLRQPALIGEILAGILVANLVVGDFVLLDFIQLNPLTPEGAVNLEFLTALSELGVIFLIFAVGLEVKASDLRKVGGIALQVAVLGVVFPFLLGFLLIIVLHGMAGTVEAMFVGAALVATSIGITAQVLRERNLLATREANVILGAAVIDDILGILVLTVTIGAAVGGVSLVQVAVVAVMSSMFVVAFVVAGPRLIRHLARPEKGLLERLRMKNAAFVLALLFCFGVSALAAFFQLAAIIGAFLAGMAMGTVEERYHLGRSFEPLNAFFVPFFFLVIGLQVNLAALGSVLPLTIAIIVLAIVSKLVGCALGARKMGKSSAIIVGVGMVPRGEVGIIVALAAFNVGAISDGLYAAIVLMSIVTSMIAPTLLTRLFARQAEGRHAGQT